ncbi:MAG TPA: ATP-dependent 6-phosphofructokinase [Candidatus Angelobacter sp.]
MNTVSTIGVSTGGGDCPGLNAVIRAVVKSAILRHGWRVIGIEDSFDGLIWPGKHRELKLQDVSGILARGGTILGTTNRGNPFCYRVVEDGEERVRDFSDEVVRNAHDLGLDGLVVVGGDGTMKIALELHRKGLMLVGIPKTIDNDLNATEVSFGFDTALHTAADAIDKVHTSAESHHRIMVIEVMGREAGWIALQAGLASGADVILIPEIPFDLEQVCQRVKQREREGKKFTIVVVAEGIKVPGRPAASEDKRLLPRTGVAANWVGDVLARSTHRETRVAVLGHIQRGGPPSPFDRILCTRFGVAATELVAQGKFGRMVALNQGAIQDVDIAEAVRITRRVDPDGELVRIAKATGVCFGG